MTYPGQGPYVRKPSPPVPTIEGYMESPRWAQAQSGRWYAFYNPRVGPDLTDTWWNTEHPTDPHWWGKKGEAAYVCRHGYQAGQCPDPNKSCGDGPSDIPASRVTATVRGLQKILGEPREADHGAELCEGDLRHIVELMTLLNSALETEDVYVHCATVVVHDRAERQIGTLRYAVDEWMFTPHFEVIDDS